MNILWVDDGRGVLPMNSTAQWSILWNAALFPPQEMLPPDSLFYTLTSNTTAATNSEHLFGFTPCIPLAGKENSGFHEHAMTETRSTDNFYDAYEAFSPSSMGEEFASFL